MAAPSDDGLVTAVRSRKRLGKKTVVLVVMALLPALLIAEPLRSLSKKIRDATKQNPPLSLAVLDFPYSEDRMSTGSYLLPERMLTYLVQDGAVVMERRRISALLSERRLSLTGIMPAASLRKLGPLLGVDAIVTGTLSDVSDEATDVLVRVIELNSARVLASGSARVEREWLDGPRGAAPAPNTLPIPSASMALAGVPNDASFDAIRITPNPTGLPIDDGDANAPRHHVTQTHLEIPREDSPPVSAAPPARYFPVPVPSFFPLSAHTFRGGPPQ